MLISEDTVNKLQSRVANDPIYKAVFNVMAQRERNRHNMTTRGLYYKLRKEGHKFQEKDLVPIFRLIAELGLATLDINTRGRVEAIRGFKAPIQKIGEMACGTVSVSRPKANSPTLMSVPKVEAVAANSKTKQTMKAALTLYVNNKPIEINLPENMTKEDLISIIGRFYGV